MADTKQILLTGITYAATVQTPNIEVDEPSSGTNSNTSTTPYATDVQTQSITVANPAIEITTSIPVASPVAGQATDISTEFAATNLGEDSIPEPRLFKFLSDEFKLNEQTLLSVFKNLTELSTTEDQVRKLIQKAFVDITSNSEVFNRVWAAFRTVSDSSATTELLQKDFAKVLADVSNSTDLLSTSVGKYLADVTALANLSYAVILVGKNLEEQIALSDVLTRIVQYNRIFEDTAFMTDDFFGEANIDDDQIAQVFKVVLDWISLPETFAVAFIKPGILDQAAIREQAFLEPQPLKLDSILNSEIRSSLIEQVKLDQISNTEQQAFNVNKPDRIDTATTSDQRSLEAQPKVFDQISDITDFATNVVGQTSVDQFSSQNELYYFDVDKPDRIDTATGIDQAALNFTKPADSDEVSIAELLLTKLIGLNINEIDYFLEDYTFDITDYTFKAVHPRDQITQIVVVKGVEDSVDATDDFLGETNVDDDQIALVSKVVVEYATFSDAFGRVVDYFRLFAETAQLLEQVVLDNSKVLLDETLNSELVNFDNFKVTNEIAATVEAQLFDIEQPNFDQAGISEQAILAISTVQSDNVVNSDDFSRFWQAVRIFSELTQTTERIEQLIEKVNVDQSTFIELVSQAVEKLASDEFTVSEQQAFDFSAVHSDLVDSTDDFFGEANIDDDQIASVDKVVVDYATNSETIITVAEFYRTFLEVAASVDQATLDFAKSILDSITTSERFAIDFATSRQDIASIAETKAVDFSTSRTETVAQADLFTQSIEPNKNETVVVNENTNYNVGLQKLETTSTAETTSFDALTNKAEIASILENFVKEWTAYKSFTETVTQTDQTLLATSKPVTETVTASETSRANVNKRQLETVVSTETTNKDVSTEFSELVDATDDFFGAANIDDDQIATVDKVVSDYAVASDVFDRVVNYLRTFTELQTLSDFTTTVVEKTSLDTAVTSEQQLFDASKSLQDASTTTDTPSLNFSTDRADSLNNTTDTLVSIWVANRVQTETAGIAEAFNLDASKAVLESTATSELIQKTTVTEYSETTTTSESFVKDATVALEELVDATDDFFGAANVDDDQIATVDKVVVDYATHSEVFERLVSYLRTFSELQSLSDFTTITADKAVLETANTAEQKIFNITNQRAETVVATEVKQLAFSTSFNNNLTGTTDNVTTQFDANRTVTETVTKSDQTTLVTNKSVLETTTTSETQTAVVGKQQLDSAITAETIDKNITTQLSDLVDATDDFYGAATVGDDEFATFDKVLVEYANTSEVVTALTDFLRSVNESQILSEVFAAATNKALSDINNSSDTVTLLPAPNKTETVATSQTISLTLQSYFSQDYVELGYTGETYTY
jgi:hypothetical protein